VWSKTHIKFGNSKWKFVQRLNIIVQWIVNIKSSLVYDRHNILNLCIGNTHTSLLKIIFKLSRHIQIMWILICICSSINVPVIIWNNWNCFEWHLFEIHHNYSYFMINYNKLQFWQYLKPPKRYYPILNDANDQSIL